MEESMLAHFLNSDNEAVSFFRWYSSSQFQLSDILTMLLNALFADVGRMCAWGDAHGIQQLRLHYYFVPLLYLLLSSMRV